MYLYEFPLFFSIPFPHPFLLEMTSYGHYLYFPYWFNLLVVKRWGLHFRLSPFLVVSYDSGNPLFNNFCNIRVPRIHNGVSNESLCFPFYIEILPLDRQWWNVFSNFNCNDYCPPVGL